MSCILVHHGDSALTSVNVALDSHGLQPHFRAKRIEETRVECAKRITNRENQKKTERKMNTLHVSPFK